MLQSTNLQLHKYLTVHTLNAAFARECSLNSTLRSCLRKGLLAPICGQKEKEGSSIHMPHTTKICKSEKEAANFFTLFPGVFIHFNCLTKTTTDVEDGVVTPGQVHTVNSHCSCKGSASKPSKHAGSNSHLIWIGSEALARSGPDDSCTPASVRTGSVWPKPDAVSQN